MSTAAAQSQQSSLAISPLAVTILCAFLLLLVPHATFLPDPLIRHDDFPAFLSEPDRYYGKTLSEGRWLNYLWHLRGFVAPPWVNFLIYNLFWAIYLGALTHLVLGARAELWRKLFVAAIAGLAVPQLLISLWFNTLLPGLGVVALYAVLSVYLSNRTCRALLLIFVPVTLTAYTTYPFFLLALCLMRRDFARSWTDLAGLLALFMASFFLGMLLIFGLNYFAHGVFGIVLADWRAPNPATGVQSLLQNFDVVWRFLYGLVYWTAQANLILGAMQGMLFAAGLYLVARRDPLKAVYPLAGLVLCLSMILAQGLKSGIVLPIRIGGFAWVYFAVFAGWLADELTTSGRGRLGRNILFTLAAIYVVFAGMDRHILTAWQRYSRDLASEIGSGSEAVYVTGTYLSLEPVKRSRLQSHHAVKFRLAYLTGRTIYVCEFAKEDCQGLPGNVLSGLTNARAGQTHEVQKSGDKIIVLLSPEPIMEPVFQDEE